MKRKLVIITVLIYSINISLFAQKDISSDVLKGIKTSFVKDDNTKAAMNAVTSNDIKDLVLNRENVDNNDHYFKYKIKVSGITNQKSSGRCWMYTSLNIFRPKVMEKLNVSSFEFSENYLYFWDILEKSNLFLENIIETADKPIENRYVDHYFSSPVSDGGVWNSFSNLVVKYGAVPKEVMGETNSSAKTRWMLRIINRKLREDGLELRDIIENGVNKKNVLDAKVSMLKDIYRVLAINLGEPPAKFEWRYEDKDGNVSELKEYTPQSFVKEVLPETIFDHYIMLMNDPTREYYKYYEIENYRNVEEGVNWKYLNLPNKDLKRMAIESIKNNEAMYASCDVGKQLNIDEGILDINNYDFEAIYGVKLGMNKKQRILSGESGSSHGMALIAVDVDENENPVKWQFENSWGADRGHNGYLTFTDEWFDNYIFRLVILKRFIDKKTLKILQQEPIVLPPWDPMS
jgi:bleomycin hydrolase